jgi:hypothetical protein
MMWVNTYFRSADLPQINAAAAGSVWSWRPFTWRRSSPRLELEERDEKTSLALSPLNGLLQNLSILLRRR